MTACEYLVSHGKSGGFGRFAAAPALTLTRGDRVVVHTDRGLEFGTVLCPANERHLQILAHTSPGTIVRPVQPADEEAQDRLESLAARIFQDARSAAISLQLGIEIVDIDILLEGSGAVIQFLGPPTADCGGLVQLLQTTFGLTVLLENLALASTESGEHEHGCGKPDCGKAGGGGCTSCGTGGGCTSCGSGKIDMTAYFAHLRTKMDDRFLALPTV